MTWSNGNDLDNYTDLCTIKYNNNGGSNYSYTVSDPRSAQDGNWSSASTWLFGSVPGSSDVVIIITTHDVAVDGSFTTNDLTINNGASVSINPDKALTVNGTLTNNAGNSGLVIKSDASGTGSLIENNGVAATCERYLTEDEWHYISSPVIDPLAGVFMGMYLKYWDEPAGIWTYITNPNQVLDTEMKGYALWTYNNATATYTGTLNTGAKTINVTSQGSRSDL